MPRCLAAGRLRLRRVRHCAVSNGPTSRSALKVPVYRQSGTATVCWWSDKVAHCVYRWSRWIMVCLVHVKIKSLVEIGTMWKKSLKFMCVEKFWCDKKVRSLKKKFRTKQALRSAHNTPCKMSSLWKLLNCQIKITINTWRDNKVMISLNHRNEKTEKWEKMLD